MFTNENEKKSKSTVFLITVSVFCLIVIGYYLLTIEPGSRDKSSQVGQMQQLTRKVQGMESDLKKKEGEVIQLVGQYKKKIGAKSPLAIDTLELSHDERELLEQQIAKEKDVSVKSMLREILLKKDRIGVLREKIAEIEDLLPAPHITKKGENHYGIALTFLVEKKGVEKEQAQKILARTALFEELAEGFKVWNFYTGEEFGTSVTKGDAKVSPNAFFYSAKKKLMDARDQVVSERDKLAENVKSLEEKQDKTITQLDRVTREKENLTAKVSQLDRRVNSVFYRLDSREKLKENGILKSGFLASAKLKDVSPGHFDKSLDLNSNDQLVISAADLGKEKIKDVVLFPRFYKKGDSYKVLITPNKKHALLTLMDIDQFKSERLVIAVK